MPAVRPQALPPTPAPSYSPTGPSNHRCGPVNKQASQLLVSRGHLPQKSSPEGRSVETRRENHRDCGGLLEQMLIHCVNLPMTHLGPSFHREHKTGSDRRCDIWAISDHADFLEGI